MPGQWTGEETALSHSVGRRLFKEEQSPEIDPKDLGKALELWRKDPNPFIRGILKADFWSGQELIAYTVANNPRTTVASCNAIGKDYTAAHLALWWLAVHEEAAVVTLAPSWHQVRDASWRDIHDAYHRSAIPFGGKLGKVSLEINERRFAVGLATDRKERIMGIHNPNLLIIVTEASGMNEEVMEGAETLAAGGNAHILLLGNPTANRGTFYRSHHDLRDLYVPLHIGYRDSPNFQGQGVVRSYLINPDYVESKRRKWGEGSPMWEIHIEGNFPQSTTDSLIQFDLADPAMRRWLRDGFLEYIPNTYQRRPKSGLLIGVDVARQGDNETVFQRRRGTWIAEPEVYEGLPNGVSLKNRIVQVIREEGPERVFIDAIGYGANLCDELEAMGMPIEPVYSSAAAYNDPDRYENLRAELWWTMRRWMENHRESFQLPKDELLVVQLCTPKYYYSKKGRIVVERKEDLKKRGLKSPDRADALALTFMDSVEEEERNWSGRKAQVTADII